MVVGAPISPDGWRPAGLSVPLLSSPCTIKPRRWHAKIRLLGIPVGASTCLHKEEVRKNSQNATQLCAKAEGCVHEDLRADKLERLGFRVGTWNVDSLTGRAGE